MTFEITNYDKILFPKDGITKLDVVKYYSNVSQFMLPYIEKRFVAAIRCHSGIEGECFFKKHPTTDKYVSTKRFNGEKYFYIEEQGQLLYQAQMGTVEFHTWACKVDKLKTPDLMTFDLDPDENLSLSKLREAVLNVKSVLKELNLISFIKTSGGKGYHIVVPFANSRGWSSFYNFSKTVAQVVEKRWENLFTTNVRKAERKGRIFIDYMRNNVGSTCVAPYSLRAREGAPVSMPISWKDLGDIAPNEVTIKNYKSYLGGAWNKFFKISQSITV